MNPECGYIFDSNENGENSAQRENRGSRKFSKHSDQEGIMNAEILSNNSKYRNSTRYGSHGFERFPKYNE